jgi:hypothetical protein
MDLNLFGGLSESSVNVISIATDLYTCRLKEHQDKCKCFVNMDKPSCNQAKSITAQLEVHREKQAAQEVRWSDCPRKWQSSTPRRLFCTELSAQLARCARVSSFRFFMSLNLQTSKEATYSLTVLASAN